MRIGVMGAMPEEVAAVVGMLGDPRVTSAGGRDYTAGSCRGFELVVAHSRIGKVAAASCAVELAVRFGVEQLVFTGLAGGLDPALGVGDVVVAEGLIQHDLDASPLFPPLEVPLTGVWRFEPDPAIVGRLETAARAEAAGLSTCGQRGGSVHRGDIATGDQFVAGEPRRSEVRARAPSALCVEMEGAAVAQVCAEYGVPFGVVRLISDGAGEAAPEEFFGSLTSAAAGFAAGLVARYLDDLAAGL